MAVRMSGGLVLGLAAVWLLKSMGWERAVVILVAAMLATVSSAIFVTEVRLDEETGRFHRVPLHLPRRGDISLAASADPLPAMSCRETWADHGRRPSSLSLVQKAARRSYRSPSRSSDALSVRPSFYWYRVLCD